MFKLEHTGGPFGDCTSTYDVILDKDYTVEEFIQTVITNMPNEWGYIGVYNKRCEYKYGELLDDLPAGIKQKNIDSVRASGGWSRMDYTLVLK